MILSPNSGNLGIVCQGFSLFYLKQPSHQNKAYLKKCLLFLQQSKLEQEEHTWVTGSCS